MPVMFLPIKKTLINLEGNFMCKVQSHPLMRRLSTIHFPFLSLFIDNKGRGFNTVRAKQSEGHNMLPGPALALNALHGTKLEQEKDRDGEKEIEKGNGKFILNLTKL